MVEMEPGDGRSVANGLADGGRRYVQGARGGRVAVEGLAGFQADDGPGLRMSFPEELRARFRLVAVIEVEPVAFDARAGRCAHGPGGDAERAARLECRLERLAGVEAYHRTRWPVGRQEEPRRRFRRIGVVEMQPLGAGAALDGAEDVARVGEAELLGRPIGGLKGYPGFQASDGPLAFGISVGHGVSLTV